MLTMKKKVGFFLPSPIVDAYEQVADRVGGKEKWQVISAAILMLLEASEAEQNEYIRRVAVAATPGNSFEQLVRDVTVGRVVDGEISHVDSNGIIEVPAVKTIRRKPRRGNAGAGTGPSESRPKR